MRHFDFKVCRGAISANAEPSSLPVVTKIPFRWKIKNLLLLLDTHGSSDSLDLFPLFSSRRLQLLTSISMKSSDAGFESAASPRVRGVLISQWSQWAPHRIMLAPIYTYFHHTAFVEGIWAIYLSSPATATRKQSGQTHTALPSLPSSVTICQSTTAIDPCCSPLFTPSAESFSPRRVSTMHSSLSFLAPTIHTLQYLQFPPWLRPCTTQSMWHLQSKASFHTQELYFLLMNHLECHSTVIPNIKQSRNGGIRQGTRLLAQPPPPPPAVTTG